MVSLAVSDLGGELGHSLPFLTGLLLKLRNDLEVALVCALEHCELVVKLRKPALGLLVSLVELLGEAAFGAAVEAREGGQLRLGLLDDLTLLLNLEQQLLVLSLNCGQVT